MEYFYFQHVVPMEERYRSLTYCENIGKQRFFKLRAYVNKIKLYIRDEERKLYSRMKNAQRNEDELKETPKDLTDESEDLTEEQDSLKEKVFFVKDELFWKGIHRKHVKEDMTALKKERMESVGILKQSLSVLTKSDKNDVELSFCRRQKLRFSSRFQRKCDYEIVSVDLLKEAFENLYDVLSHVAQMKNKI